MLFKYSARSDVKVTENLGSGLYKTMNKEYYLVKATKFISDYYADSNLADVDNRLELVTREIESTGIWTPTTEELVYGCKLAWRNSNRCIGRLFYNTLHVIDKRNLQTEEGIFSGLVEHLKFATNRGKIRSVLTVFNNCSTSKQIRIWNAKLIRYAGYIKGNVIIGDPEEVEFTKVCNELGWVGEGTQFDLLPVVIQIGNNEPKWFELPKEVVLEVQIVHPEYNFFQELNLKWYAVPVISDMALRIGGIEYTAAPFNGWYMETEIGSRNFGDEKRFNLLPLIAKKMSLDTRSKTNLWKDKALIELNCAVLYSFRKAGVSITDHHSASKQFMRFCEKEKESGREVMADWAWIVPPMGASSMEVFHNLWENSVVDPNFYYQTSPWSLEKNTNELLCPFHKNYHLNNSFE